MKKLATVFLNTALLFGLSTAAWAGHHQDAHQHKAHQHKNIVSTAIDAGQFKTLAAALQATDLAKVLQGEGPFTVFAPSDAAFAKLPKGTIESLLNDKEKLKAILLYHVVPGKVLAKDVVNVKSATTANGKDINVKVKSNQVFINSAKVVKTDIVASNGIIHVIDEVILPPT